MSVIAHENLGDPGYQLHARSLEAEHAHRQDMLFTSSPTHLNHIPDGVLIRILAQLTLSMGPSMHMHLVRATHVCRRWRIVAIGAPLLWARFSLENDALTEMFLARSLAIPVSIYIDRQSDLKALRPYTHRIRCLYIREEEGLSTDALAEDMPHPAAGLEELHLIGRHRTSASSGAHYDFGNITPALRMLQLEAGFSRSVRIMTQNIRDLRLANMCAADGFSVGALLDVLRDTPRLERLELNRVDADDTVDVQPPVELPHLALAAVLDTKSTVFTTLLRNLVLPEITEALYTIQDTPSNLEHLILTQNGDPLVKAPISQVLLTISPNGADPSRTDLILRGLRSNNQRALALTLANCNPAEDFDLAHICRLEQVEYLAFSDPASRGPGAQWWAAALVGMTRLQTLHINLHRQPTVPGPLLRALEAEDGDVPCATLESVVVREMIGAHEVWDALERFAAARLLQAVPLTFAWMCGHAGEEDNERMEAIREHVLGTVGFVTD